MAKYIIEDTTLKNIADAIRSKNGESAEYLPSEMPGKIEEIEGGGGTGTGGSGYTIKYINSAIKNGEATADELMNDIENGVYINGRRAFYSNKTFDYSLLNEKNLKITDGYYMFAYTKTLLDSTNVDISNFDVSKVLDFSYMFSDCSALNYDISSWDMSNAENCAYMFSNNTYITAIKLGNLNSQNITSLEGMFNYCQKLKSIEGLENIKTSKCETFEKMFYYCIALKDFDLDLSSWEIGTETSSAPYFQNFLQYAKVKSVKFPEGANVSFSYMFDQATVTELVDLSKVNLHKNILAVSYMLYYADLPGGIILPDFGHVTSDITLGNSSTKAYNLTFGEGNSFGNTSTKSSLVLNMTNIWRSAATNNCPTGYGEGTYGDLYEAFANSIAENTSGLTRTIKLNTALYNSLSDEQKALLTDKNYTLSYGTS